MKRLRKKALEIQILTSGDETLDLSPPWVVDSNRLVAEYSFNNFDEAKKFVDEISILAELHNHHPDVSFGWGYVNIILFTHDQNAITDMDLKLAQAISQI